MKKLFNRLTYIIVFVAIFFISLSCLTYGVVRPKVFTEFFNILNNKTIYFLMSLLIALLCFAIFSIFKNTKIDNSKVIKILYKEQVFFILMVVVGIVFSILIPIYQSPDEISHLGMISEDFSMESPYSILFDCNDTVRIIRNVDQKINPNTYFVFNTFMSLDANFSFPSLKVIQHFPQAIMYIICSGFHLPVLIGFTLCEITATVFYSFVCYRALKILPCKKLMMMCVMLFPICIQQMGSFSYDVVLLACSFYLISYILYLKFTKEKITLKNILVIGFLVFIIGVVKIPYILIGSLVFILPIKKLYIKIFSITITYKSIRNHKILTAIFIVFFICVAILFLLLFLQNSPFGRLLVAVFFNFIDALKLVLRSLLLRTNDGSGPTQFECYMNTISGGFGWLDTPNSFLNTLFVFVSLILFCFLDYDKCGQCNTCKFSRFDVVVAVIVFLVLSFIIIISMIEHSIQIYLNSNLKIMSVDEIGKFICSGFPIVGVQGRYFIPVIPVLLMVVSNKKITNYLATYNYKFYTILYYVLIISFATCCVAIRYWITF